MTYEQLHFQTEPDPPAEYQALVGRVFRQIGANAVGDRAFRVAAIVYKPHHRHGPWIARTFAHGWNPVYLGPRYRKAALFLDPKEYEEVDES